MKIKVDKDLPKVIVTMLQDAGHDAMSVYEQAMGGWKDPELWEALQEDERFFITADKGFGDIRVYPPGKHFGVLILRPDEDGIRSLVSLLEQALENFDINELKGTLAVVTNRSIRVRRE